MTSFSGGAKLPSSLPTFCCVCGFGEDFKGSSTTREEDISGAHWKKKLSKIKGTEILEEVQEFVVLRRDHLLEKKIVVVDWKMIDKVVHIR